MIGRLARYSGLVFLAAAVILSCSSKKESTGIDVNKVLQASGRWQQEKRYTDDDSSKVSLRYVFIFKAPNIYRWETIGTRDGKDDPNLSHKETGTYTIEGDKITFNPDNGQPWTATFELVEGSGDLSLVKEDGESFLLVYYHSSDWG